MPSPLTIITGASRGLGLAMARQLHAAGHRLLAISRSAGAELPAEVTQWSADLVDAPAAAERLEAWLREQDPAAVSELTMIHNAALLHEPRPLAEVSTDELSRGIRASLEAPLVLSAAFLRASADWPLPRKLLFISSGLGRRGMAGTAAYCAAKAGLDNLARALQLEEAERPNGAEVVSLAPGVIDTGMQVTMRGADPARFGSQRMFASLHSGGRLDSPAQAAAKVLRFLTRDDFGANPVADVRDD
jgi:NAD(P)-dependent dehydrogenase (short-subunit alcohol dehydrogenase family)